MFEDCDCFLTFLHITVHYVITTSLAFSELLPPMAVSLVVTACQGTDALNTLQNKKRKVDLVLMTTKLPDMCAFEVLDILQMNFRLPVVSKCQLHFLSIMRFHFFSH